MIVYNNKKLKILQCTNPALRQRSDEVQEFDKTLNDLARDLARLMKDPLNNGVETVGISAVQVGIKVRICVCKNLSTDKNIIMINPEILNASSELSEELEGCISVGEGNKQLFAYVPRPKLITVKYFDLKGQEAQLNAKGLLSHIVQHEIDHMDGKLFIDYIKDPHDIMTLEELNERDGKVSPSL